MCVWLTVATPSRHRAWVPPEPQAEAEASLANWHRVWCQCYWIPQSQANRESVWGHQHGWGFLPWHLWSKNNPRRKGYQCFLETHDRVCNLSPSTASRLLHTQDYTHPHNGNDIPNHKHNYLLLWSPCTLKIWLFQRRQISYALFVLAEDITERVGGGSPLRVRVPPGSELDRKLKLGWERSQY